MKSELVLDAEIRKEAGSRSAAIARGKKKIPAVLYGHKKETVSLLLDARAFSVILHQGHRLIDAKIGGKTDKVLIKALQYDYLGRDIIHVDLMRVDISEMIKIKVPLELKGIAQGTQEGGIVEPHASELEIECKVTDIPDVFIVSVKELEVGGSLHARDVELPAGVKLVSDPELLMVTCALVAAAKSTEDLEEHAPATPEVIGEKAEEGGESEDKKEQSGS